MVLTTDVVELAMRERTVNNEALAVFLTSKWIDDGPVTLEDFRALAFTESQTNPGVLGQYQPAFD